MTATPRSAVEDPGFGVEFTVEVPRSDPLLPSSIAGTGGSPSSGIGSGITGLPSASGSVGCDCIGVLKRSSSSIICTTTGCTGKDRPCVVIGSAVRGVSEATLMGAAAGRAGGDFEVSFGCAGVTAGSSIVGAAPGTPDSPRSGASLIVALASSVGTGAFACSMEMSK